MRLFLFPITTRRILIYAQRLNRQLTTEQTYTEKVTSKAGDTWAKWEGAESGWQKKVTEWGNKAFARIPYQEWGLKSIPPLSTRRQKHELEGKEAVVAAFPPDIIKPSIVLDRLQQLATERQSLHRKWMWWSLVGSPFTIPFAAVPIVPNLPFFYLAFRAWSHWRALGGSKHVEYLLRKGLINPTPSDVLQRIYDTGEVPKARLDELKKISRESTDLDTRQWLVMETLIHSAGATSTKADQAHSEHERILVSKGAGKLISFYFDLPQVEIEIERAVAQVQRAMASEQKRQSEKHGTTAEEPEKREPKP